MTRPDRFSVWLREQAEPAFTDAVEHRFVEALGQGTLPDDVFRRYLRQDYAFIGTVTRLTGHALGQAPTADARRALTEELDVLTGPEDDYFERAFADLDGPASAPDRGPTTEAFDDLMVRAAYEGDYEESLAVLAAAEWIYLAWAKAAADAGGADRWYLVEWIDIHRGPAFERYVSFLRAELDRYGPSLSDRRQERVARLFGRTADLEVAFFEQAFDGSMEVG